jgi:nicotinamidase-related amidase
MSPSLLVVDLQQGFINEHTRHLPRRIGSLLARVGFDPLIFTRFTNPPGSQYENLIGWQGMRSAPYTDLCPELEGFAALIADKTAYSFLTPSLKEYLRSRGVSELHVCGLDTDICVTRAAVELFEAGFRPLVLADCCFSHGGPEFHRMALRILPRLIGPAQIIPDTEAHFRLPPGSLDR